MRVCRNSPCKIPAPKGEFFAAKRVNVLAIAREHAKIVLFSLRPSDQLAAGIIPVMYLLSAQDRKKGKKILPIGYLYALPSDLI